MLSRSAESRGVFLLTAGGLLGAWALHNYFLLPIERAWLSRATLGGWLVVLRAVVWLGPIAVFLRWRGLSAVQGLALGAPSGTLSAWASLLPGVFVLALAVGLAPPRRSWGAALLSTEGALLLSIVLLEEILMRGFLHGGLRRWISGRATVLVVASSFALMHLPAWLSEGMSGVALSISLGFVWLLGLALGIAREGTGSLWPPCLVHLLNNTIAAASA